MFGLTENKNKGFHLIDLLITVSLVGILSAFAIPIYSSHMLTVHRFEASVLLSKLALGIEEYFTQNNTYKGVNLTELGFHPRIANNRYKLVIKSATDNAFIVQAIPLNDQVKDVRCGILSLNSMNQKQISGSGSVNECW